MNALAPRWYLSSIDCRAHHEKVDTPSEVYFYKFSSIHAQPKEFQLLTLARLQSDVCWLLRNSDLKSWVASTICNGIVWPLPGDWQRNHYTTCVMFYYYFGAIRRFTDTFVIWLRHSQWVSQAMLYTNNFCHFKIYLCVAVLETSNTKKISAYAAMNYSDVVYGNLKNYPLNS